MTRFSATNTSQAVVAAPRADIWTVLTDPVQLPRLTPLLRRIDTDGDLWRWHLAGLSVLGVVYQTAVLMAFFIPFSYLMDRMMYRTYLRRTGQEPPRAQPRRR